MMIDMQVALSLDLDVDARVTRQQIEHVIEKTYARGDGRAAFAVKVDRNLDGGFLGGTFHRRLAHGLLRGAQRLLSGLWALRQSSARRICIAGGQLLNHA